MFAGQDGDVLDLVVAGAAAVGAVVAYEGAVAEEEQVGVGVEQGLTLAAAEAVDVPSVVCWGVLVNVCGRFEVMKGSRWRNSALISWRNVRSPVSGMQSIADSSQ